MRRYRGGETVGSGLYFRPRRLSFTWVEEREALPGGPEAGYRRVPLLLLMVVGPVLGLAYVIFLPFLGFAVVTGLAAVKLGQLGRAVAGQATRIVRPAWAPALAFFSRSKPAKGGRPAPDPWAEDVKKKIGEGDGDTA